MKNIHLLPTPNSSRLVKNSNENTLKLCIQTLPLDEELGCIPQHIYITSDENLKSGDWALNIEENTIFKPSNDEIYDIKNSEAKYYEYCKKIILTTDQDLIADGVQAIDDEFLEWFVKNPSCEEVKIEDYGTLYNFRYLILIPQEEPKQDPTLEEVAAKHFNQEIFVEGVTIQYALQEAFITGAKWQQEKMYSEEDMRKAFRGFTSGKSFKEWFEQFKNK